MTELTFLQLPVNLKSFLSKQFIMRLNIFFSPLLYSGWEKTKNDAFSIAEQLETELIK